MDSVFIVTAKIQYRKQSQVLAGAGAETYKHLKHNIEHNQEAISQVAKHYKNHNFIRKKNKIKKMENPHTMISTM